MSGKVPQFLMSLAIINTAKPADVEDRPVKFISMNAFIPRCLMLKITAKVDVQIILRFKVSQRLSMDHGKSASTW